MILLSFSRGLQVLGHRSIQLRIGRLLHVTCRYSSLRSVQQFISVEQHSYDAAAIAMAKEFKVKHGGRKRQKLEYKIQDLVHLREGNHEEILAFESVDLLARLRKSKSVSVTGGADVRAQESSIVPAANVDSGDQEGRRLKPEIELEIVELSSTGDGLAVSAEKDHIFVVPFSVPGDRVLARNFVSQTNKPWSNVDFLQVIRPSPKRNGVVPGCNYFATCSGCQFQMLPYEEQLAHKKTIVEKAFRNFSGLSKAQIPPVRDTMGSPLQYGYRTKLTPHFDGPPRRGRERQKFTEVPEIGFTRKNMRKVMDIENCPIATDIIQEGLKVERKKVAVRFDTYKNGATILLRETTARTFHDKQSENNEASAAIQAPTLKPNPEPASKETSSTMSGAPQITVTYPDFTDVKTYTSDNDNFCTEYISDFKFTSRAGSFFQNNNSILSPFLSYVRDNCLPPPSSSTASNGDASISDTVEPPIKYLLDAYCGSGLFTVTLSSLFTSALGIDIDKHSIVAARLNAENNSISNAGFLAADAGDLFADVPFPNDQSLVVIDPPRKGASENFLKQLWKFAPRRVVYVSCNVHTQARDVGMLVNGFGGKWKYTIESLRGFDFFPQTGHVEGVCVLDRSIADETEGKVEAADNDGEIGDADETNEEEVEILKEKGVKQETNTIQASQFVPFSQTHADR